MALNDSDKAIVREIAWQVADALQQRWHAQVAQAIETHALKCDTGFTVRRWGAQAKAILVGVFLGGLLVGGASVGGILRLVGLI